MVETEKTGDRIFATTERIKKYIERTDIDESLRKKYGASVKEVISLCSVARGANLAYWAFEYGMAKGYRAAKAEARR